MITKFKLYEELKKEPQTGDYVICIINIGQLQQMQNFLLI